MDKKISLFMTALACVLGWGCFSFLSLASEAQDPVLQTQEERKEQEDTAVQDGYITISVDAEDDSGELTYSIDSDAPEAFGQSNVFMIDPTIPHTIYVKDGAGNITSQSFQPIGVEFREDGYTGLIARDDSENNVGGTLGAEGTATGEGFQGIAEDGSGTMHDKVTTDGTDAFSRVFYTLTTKEGEVFYLIIDQNRGQENVYLLNTVTIDELQALADENGYALSERKNQSASDNLPDLSGGETIDDVVGNAPAPASKKKGGITANAKSTIMILVVAVIGGGAYYYLKVVKKKKDAAMDEIDNALDMDDFTSEADDREEIEMPADQAISDDEFYSDIYDEEESAYLDMDPDEEEEE